jgi:hypothetical protein
MSSILAYWRLNCKSPFRIFSRRKGMGEYNRYGEKDVRPDHFRQKGGFGRLYQSYESGTEPSLSGHLEDADNWSQDSRSEASQENHTGKGPKGWSHSESILAQASEALYLHPSLDAREIEIRMNGETIILEGEVMNRQQKKMAERIVEQISGVNDVQNLLKLSRNNPKK